MAAPTYNYEVEKEHTQDEIQYLFVSTGHKDIIKAVQYNYVGNLDEKRIFNLAFGDYYIETDTIDDEANTANGDVFKVFNTVLNTIPSFFEIFANEIIVVSGSDSKLEFIEKCKKECKKNCKEECRKAGRRIGIYRSYVDKNFEVLSNDFVFYGGNPALENPQSTLLEPYIVNKKYSSVFIFKNNA